ncbi:hypothetical protein Dsin_002581 [Dipteronia sinensis]|uniref:RNase H type-1 domain-containing protein n=1 Tax=Dipteronia sinensis TaxID=43782 RepID=A0AAE0B7C4_9ROSI|nr:hypothetical protein Dsin_002581 [Dipteronia sinensis]
MTAGDRNTKFFHTRASSRRRKNFIQGLFTDDGRFLDTDPTLLGIYASISPLYSSLPTLGSRCGKTLETECHALFWCLEGIKIWRCAQLLDLVMEFQRLSSLDTLKGMFDRLEFQNTYKALSTTFPLPVQVPQGWKAPPLGCLKLNSDSSVRQGRNFIGIRAAIRDDTCMVVATVSKPLPGNFSVELGELLALREGLLLAKRHNLIVKFAEVDASSVASLLNSDVCYLGDALFVIYDIKALCSEVGGCSCQAIPRSSNTLAHTLASLAFSSDVDLFWRDVNPLCLFSG